MGILGTNCPYGNPDCPHCNAERGAAQAAIAAKSCLRDGAEQTPAPLSASVSSNLVSAARAVLGLMTYDKECVCEKCNVLLALEAAVVADETECKCPHCIHHRFADPGAWVCEREHCGRTSHSSSKECHWCHSPRPALKTTTAKGPI